MSSGHVGPPPASSPHAGASRNAPSHPGWWVVAGVAATLSIILVVWLVLSSGDAGPKPTTPQQSSSPPSVSSTAPGVTVSPPATTDGADWGPLPPKNLDSLRDLSGSQMAKKVGEYVLENESRSENLVIAGYSDIKAYRTMTATLGFDSWSYKISVANLKDAAYNGRAVCGISAEEPQQPSCIMVGKAEILTVGTADDGATVAEVSAFIEELYDAL